MDLVESPLEGARRHPWERTRARFFLDRLRTIARRPGATVLDLGAGDAYFAGLASSELGVHITCADLGYDAETRARLGRLYPSLELVREVPDRRYDVVIALDVAEHVEDDLAFVSEIAEKRLAPSGHLLFSVPAHRWLWSSHDVALKHFRRYGRGEGRRLLERAGLEVVEDGSLFGSLVMPRAVSVALEKVRGPSGKPASEGAIAWNAPSWVTSAVMSALAVDARVSMGASKAGVPLPGLSYWAVAHQRADG
jgi:SAM-dependent methyltransferase